MKKTISQACAIEIAKHFHKRRGRAGVYVTRDDKKRMHVEVIVSGDVVVVSTFFGSPTVDGRNIDEVVQCTPAQFYKAHKLMAK
ncbi:hypothetical protein D3C87_1476320 [compost metagenome]